MPFVELWRLKELYRTIRGKHRAKNKREKLWTLLLFGRKIVVEFSLLVLRKSLDISADSFRLEPVVQLCIYRFATEGQLSFFMGTLWSYIRLISSYTGKKYVAFFCMHVILIGFQVPPSFPEICILTFTK